jgi:putative FmdB family regulatory protein
MPTYEFQCDLCKYKTEWVGTFEQVQHIVLCCPRCLDTANNPVKMRRLITGGTGFVLNGPAKDWPSKAGRLHNADREIQRQRRKACVLKDRGEAPKDAVLGLKESDRLYDSKHTEGELDKLYKDSVEEGR